MSNKLDKANLLILELLQNNSNISIKDISLQIGLSQTPTHERIKWLERQGYISKYVALIDRKKLGLKLLVYCFANLKDQSLESLYNFEKTVIEIPEVLEVIALSGQYDYMIKIVTTDIEAYNELLVHKFSRLPSVHQFHSHIALSEAKRDTAYPFTKLKEEL